MCTHVYAWVMEIGTRELRANLAAALRQVGAGERLVITVDGRPVAQLGPVEASGAPTLTDLAASGLVEPPRRAQPAEPPDAVDTAVDVRLDQVLAEVRGG
jgi:prevent-host-death family protein